MRSSFVLALLVLAATSGCVGGGSGSAADDNGADGAPAGPAPPPADADGAGAPETPTTPPTSPPASEPTGQPAPEPAPEPAPDAGASPKVVYDATFDFASQGDATGQSPKSAQTNPVAAAHAFLSIDLTLERSSATPAAVPVSGTLNSPTVRLLDPQGVEVLAVSEEGVTRQQVPAVPGEWTVRYEGAGTLRATLVLTALS